MKGPQEKPVAKRKKIDNVAKVITCAEYLQAIEDVESGVSEEESETEMRQNTRVKKKLKTMKILKKVYCVFGKISAHLLLKRIIKALYWQGSPTFFVTPGRTHFCTRETHFCTILFKATRTL